MHSVHYYKQAVASHCRLTKPSVVVDFIKHVSVYSGSAFYSHATNGQVFAYTTVQGVWRFMRKIIHLKLSRPVRLTALAV